jgi:hypothetical protein
MNKTQNDLSHDLAQLDYQALINTAKIGLGSTMESISQYLGKLRDIGLYGCLDTVALKLNSQWLCDEAQKLQIVGETLATLIGGLDRGTIEIINK